MKIGIDAGCLSVKEEGQTGIYNLVVGALKGLSDIINNEEMVLYTFGKIDKKLVTSLGNKFRIKKVLPRRYWMGLAMSRELFLEPPDVFLGFGQALPLFGRTKKVLFVYDLAFELYPESYSNSQKLSSQTRRAVRSADIIVAISKATKRDLEKLYGVEGDKIKVLYPGCNEIFSPKNRKEISRVQNKFHISFPYLLYVGSYKPLKNVSRIVQAFTSAKLSSHKLILAGGNVDQLKNLGQMTFLSRNVVNLGYVPKGDLPGLYSGADIFISPSLYEGFGIPILEAMSCGVPVITSKTSSMPEVVGEAGITVNPISIKEITRAINIVTNDKKSLNSYSKKGLMRSKAFSSKQFSKDLLEIIYSLSK